MWSLVEHFANRETGQVTSTLESCDRRDIQHLWNPGFRRSRPQKRQAENGKESVFQTIGRA